MRARRIAMKIYDVTDEVFREYGKIVDGIDSAELLKKLDEVSPCPDDSTVYVPDDAALDALPVHDYLRDHVYGGLPIQIGYCSGTNTLLNCLEYHRGAELNIASSSFVLLLARVQDIKDGKIDSSAVKAFRVPANTAVLVYETTLHYAPCGHFKVLVVLPKGTNETKPAIKAGTWEDSLLWANNKWLIAHPDTSEAAAGAYVGITGGNIDIAEDLR